MCIVAIIWVLGLLSLHFPSQDGTGAPEGVQAGPAAAHQVSQAAPVINVTLWLEILDKNNKL